MLTGDGLPKISIIIAALNAESTLPAQLAALEAQRPKVAWEVIIADNGSQDHTADLVREWSTRMPELRLVDAAARRGPAAARNLGVAAARGSCIAFCDADDEIGDGWVTATLRALQSHQFVAGRFDVERFRPPSAFSVSWSPQLDGLTALSYMPGFVTAGAGNMAMHRAAFDTIGGFDEGALTAEDDDLCLRAQLAGYRLAYEPDMVLHVRLREGLPAIFTQAKQYGRGARRLEHRFALIAADPRVVPPKAPVLENQDILAGRTPSEHGQTPARRVVNRARIANAIWRIGWQIGWRRANLTDVVQLTLDDVQRR